MAEACKRLVGVLVMIRTGIFSILGMCLSTLAYAAPGDVVNMWAAPVHGNSAMPSGLGWDGTNLWISSPPSQGALYNRISQHNAYTGAVLSYFDHSPTSNFHHGLTFDTATTMFTDRFYSEIVQLDISGNELIRYDAQGDVYGVAYVEDSGTTSAILYQVDILTNVLYGLNPTTGAVTSSVALGFSSAMTAGLAWDGVALWVVSTTDDTLYRVDVSTGAVLSSFAAPGNSPSGLAWDGSCLWHSDTSSDLVYRIDHGVASLPACTALTQPDAGVPAVDSGAAAPIDAGVPNLDSGAPPQDSGPVGPNDTGVGNMDSQASIDSGAVDTGFALDAMSTAPDARPREDASAAPRADAAAESTTEDSSCSCRANYGRSNTDKHSIFLLGLIALVIARRRRA